MAVFDLYSSKKNNKAKSTRSLLGLSTAALFFHPASAIIKAESIRPSSSAVKPFIKTSNALSWWMHAQRLPLQIN